MAGYGEATPFLEIAYNAKELFRVCRALDQQAEVVRKGQVVEVPTSALSNIEPIFFSCRPCSLIVNLVLSIVPDGT